MDENELSNVVIGAAIEVHRQVGPGLLEAIYRDCLFIELGERGISAECEVPLAMCYRGHEFQAAYRLDMLVESRLVLELKAVEQLMPVHNCADPVLFEAQWQKTGPVDEFQCAGAAGWDSTRR